MFPASQSSWISRMLGFILLCRRGGSSCYVIAPLKQKSGHKEAMHSSGQGNDLPAGLKLRSNASVLAIASW